MRWYHEALFACAKKNSWQFQWATWSDINIWCQMADCMRAYFNNHDCDDGNDKDDDWSFIHFWISCKFSKFLQCAWNSKTSLITVNTIQFSSSHGISLNNRQTIDSLNLSLGNYEIELNHNRNAEELLEIKFTASGSFKFRARNRGWNNDT